MEQDSDTMYLRAEEATPIPAVRAVKQPDTVYVYVTEPEKRKKAACGGCCCCTMCCTLFLLLFFLIPRSPIILYKGTTYYYDTDYNAVNEMTQSFKVKNRNFYSIKYNNLRLNQTCVDQDTGSSFYLGTVEPGQKLELSSQQSKNWDLNWNVNPSAGSILHRLCLQFARVECTTKGHVDVTMWNKKYSDVKVGPWTKFGECVQSSSR